MTLEEFTSYIHIIGIETAQEIFRLVTSTHWPAQKIHDHIMARIDKEAAVKRKAAMKA